MNDWFRGTLGEVLRTRLREHAGPIDRAVALRYLDEHQYKGRDHGYRLWLLHSYLTFQGI